MGTMGCQNKGYLSITWFWTSQPAFQVKTVFLGYQVIFACPFPFPRPFWPKHIRTIGAFKFHVRFYSDIFTDVHIHVNQHNRSLSFIDISPSFPPFRSWIWRWTTADKSSLGSQNPNAWWSLRQRNTGFHWCINQRSKTILWAGWTLWT